MEKRQTAFKVWIKDLIQGKYFVEEGWTPNYVLTDYGLKASRVNLIATIVKISNEDEAQKFIYVDDGSAEISLRDFGEVNVFKGFNIGDTIQIIARVREYNGEKYLTPEIIKKVDDIKWLQLRKIELEKDEERHTPLKESVSQEVIIETEKKDTTEFDEIIDLINRLDEGSGADFDKIITESKNDKCEEMINTLLMNGEVFELKPGKLKVLE